LEKNKLRTILKKLEIVYSSDKETVLKLIKFINEHKKETEIIECKWLDMSYGEPDIFDRRTWPGDGWSSSANYIKVGFSIKDDRLFCYAEAFKYNIINNKNYVWEAAFYLLDDFIINLEQHISNKLKAHIDQQYALYLKKQEDNWKAILRNNIIYNV